MDKHVTHRIDTVRGIDDAPAANAQSWGARKGKLDIVFVWAFH